MFQIYNCKNINYIKIKIVKNCIHNKGDDNDDDDDDDNNNNNNNNNNNKCVSHIILWKLRKCTL